MLINKLLNSVGIKVRKLEKYKILEEKAYEYDRLKKIMNSGLLRNRNIDYLNISKSQLGQDIFVLSQLDFKKNGFFIEFGATNGIDLSNTYLLEKEFGWKGILAEPARCWHNDLQKNRSAIIEHNCVWKESNINLNFHETNIAELSTIEQYKDIDHHNALRSKGLSYQVSTISLLDMLIKNKAPKDIDYLSIDTEGSEFEILQAFDFNQYNIKIITCEHNYTNSRELIFNLLTSHGYKRVFTELSEFDDWYIKH